MNDDTIFALATASGRAGIAVLRVSGPNSGTVLRALGGPSSPSPRRACVASFRGADGEILDKGMFVWFPGPASFTGEDMVEFHVHGSHAVIEAIADAISSVPGCRQAEPGEFTRRAFNNQKLDLTEVEGLVDLIAAETAAQRRQALAQMGGQLGRLYEAWRDRLLKARARLEAEIDFSDQDLPGGLDRAVRAEVDAVRQEIEGHLAQGYRGERIRGGIQVVIIGAPNVGKSTIFNRIAGREAAIVSDIPGTTRDVLDVNIDLAGFPVTVSDTAGIRDSADAIETEGVHRAQGRALTADYVLAVFDATQPLDPKTEALIRPGAIPVLNKIDLPGAALTASVCGLKPEVVCAQSGAGISNLIERIKAQIMEDFKDTGSPTLTRARHRQALEECRDSLWRFVNTEIAELAAEELRIAVQALGCITGRVGVEDMLDVVFREFCVGK